MGQEHIEWVFDDAKATILQRGEERDQPDGERTIPRCVTAFNAITGHDLSNCDGWMFMEILKQCRSVQGSYKYDDYRDRLGYAALAAEEARMEEEDRVLCDQTTEEAEAARKKQLSRDIADQMGWETPEDVQRDLKAKGYGKPGQVVEICKHKRSNCYECKLFNKDGINITESAFVPPECDNRERG